MKKYLSKINSNFSIGEQEFYCVAGEKIELPQHEIIESLEKRGDLIEVVKKEKTKK